MSILLDCIMMTMMAVVVVMINAEYVSRIIVLLIGVLVTCPV
jgi:hypothetical protein